MDRWVVAITVDRRKEEERRDGSKDMRVAPAGVIIFWRERRESMKRKR